ncbi:cell wall-binding protein [Bacillus sp. JCM 19047]|nr:cell wall-binding protein [Bacillus sp. JCM 19047]
MKYMIGMIATFLMGVLFLLPDHTYATSVQTIETNEESERVEWLQSQLVEQDFLKEENMSSIFDDATVEAVKAYQEEHGLSVDGIVGKQTLGALEILQEGSQGLLVEALQKKLQELNYYSSSIDGQFGPLTTQAVVAFQQANHLLVDGIAGPETHAHLYYNQTKVANVVESTPATKQQEEQETQAEQTEDTTTSEEEQTVEVTAEAEVNNKKKEETTIEEETTAVEEETTVAVNESAGQTMTMEATAYTAYCEGCSGVTRTGIDLRANPNQKVVAVDPNVIPLGSRVYVEGYGEAIAGDTGGAIKGQKIDLYVQTKDEAFQFGRQQVQVTVLN